MTDYDSFVASKLLAVPPTGIACDRLTDEHLSLFQRDLVTWGLRRGRAALFADTGLGKTRMQITWAKYVAEHTGGSILILSPLSVAKQTAAEGERIGVTVTRAFSGHDVKSPGLYVTNYDKLHLFADLPFSGVVLDESSIIKHNDSKTFAILTERFASTAFRLCASATPSPNDYTELGTHAEFLGICSREEMLAEFFTHDGGDTSKWRLKKHARTAFWRWVASWAALVRRPSDIDASYSDDGYLLPPISMHEHVIPADPEQTKASGLLFAEPASTLTERRQAKKSTRTERVAACVDAVNAEPKEQWVVWCELNAEQDELAKLLGDSCFSIAGSLSSFDKEIRHDMWLRGERRVLVTKPSIFGFGLNWQHCARMAFVGVTDSFESFYQAIRREWRFGQKREVHVHLFSSELEGNVLANLKRKQADAGRMADELSTETREMVRAEVAGVTRQTNSYESRRIVVPPWIVTKE